MPWPTPEEIGNIVARLAIADNDFLVSLLIAADKAGNNMLPEDVEKLVRWAKFIKALRSPLGGPKNES